MNPTDSKESFVQRHLDPTDSLSELLFGAIMALTITLGAGLIVQEGSEATTRILFGILGCNVAWGLIDAGMYVMDCMLERSRKVRLLESIQAASDEEDALALIGHELDDRLELSTSPEERSRLYQAMLERLRTLPPEHTGVQKEDLLGAVAVFWLVSLSTIPAILPFFLLHDRFAALRVSNLLLLALLFLAGYRWASATHGHPWRFGAVLMLIGLAMVAIAMALGG